MGVWERAQPAFLDALGKEFAFTPSYDHGYDIRCRRFALCNAGDVKVFIAMGGNFLSATPDTSFRGSGTLKRCFR